MVRHTNQSENCIFPKPIQPLRTYILSKQRIAKSCVIMFWKLVLKSISNYVSQEHDQTWFDKLQNRHLGYVIEYWISMIHLQHSFSILYWRQFVNSSPPYAAYMC